MLTQVIAIGSAQVTTTFALSHKHGEVKVKARGLPTITMFREGRKTFSAQISDDQVVSGDAPAKVFAAAIRKFWQ